MVSPPVSIFVIDRRPEAHYRIAHQDNSRWYEFVFRPGDIVISTRSRSGTTRMQMICALLTGVPASAARMAAAMGYAGV